MIASHFAALGAKLSLSGRNEQNLKHVMEECHAAGANTADVVMTIGDLTCLEVRQKLVDNTVEAFGKIDILVVFGLVNLTLL